MSSLRMLYYLLKIHKLKIKHEVYNFVFFSQVIFFKYYAKELNFVLVFLDFESI